MKTVLTAHPPFWLFFLLLIQTNPCPNYIFKMWQTFKSKLSLDFSPCTTVYCIKELSDKCLLENSQIWEEHKWAEFRNLLQRSLIKKMLLGWNSRLSYPNISVSISKKQWLLLLPDMAHSEPSWNLKCYELNNPLSKPWVIDALLI